MSEGDRAVLCTIILLMLLSFIPAIRADNTVTIGWIVTSTDLDKRAHAEPLPSDRLLKAVPAGIGGGLGGKWNNGREYGPKIGLTYFGGTYSSQPS
jgi:hypothetical protein